MGCKVCHLSSVHRPFDTRIFHKECKTLAKSGFNVTLIVQIDKECVVDGVKLVPIFKPKNRKERFTKTIRDLYRKAISEDAEVYHIHDPELIPVALLLKRRGKKIIYDVHEYYPFKILDKEWIPGLIRPMIKTSFDFFERKIAEYFDAIICADRYTASRFPEEKTIVLANYPIVESYREFIPENRQFFKKDIFWLIYAGGLTKSRGFFEMVELMKNLSDRGVKNVKLRLLGRLEKESYLDYIRDMDNIHYHGLVPLSDVYQFLRTSDIGLAIFRPVPAYSYYAENTIKIFEYMLFSMPIIASNFPGLQRIIEGIGCGKCVDPTNIDEIADAVLWMIGHPELMTEMGKRGQEKVLEEWNWEKESEKLVKLYKKLCEA